LAKGKVMIGKKTRRSSSLVSKCFAGLIVATMFSLELAAKVLYVDASSPSPISPYGSWATAAGTLQDAVDAAMANDEIVATNGVYASGGVAMFGIMTNRVAVTKPLTLRSVNGPGVTFIQGYQLPGPAFGDGAIRCVYLAGGARLIGFTLTNGATRRFPNGGDWVKEQNGAGVWCESLSAIVSNCVITRNSAGNDGGGAYSGTLIDCSINENYAWNWGAGTRSSSVSNSTLRGNSGSYGGGAHSGTLSNCKLINNYAEQNGGGTYGATLSNCALVGNSGADGGGEYTCTLYNCMLTGNSAKYGGSAASLGILNNCTLLRNWVSFGTYTAYHATLRNCIIYASLQSYFAGEYSGGTLDYCCTTPMPTTGTGNITNAPLMVDEPGGNFRLQPNSPCVNAGNNAFAIGNADVDGKARISGGTVDIGAYEFQGQGVGTFRAWLEGYGLPTEGSDSIDSDGDGLNNLQEWMAGTVPTNAASSLYISKLSADGAGISVTWKSVSGRKYSLLQGTDLSLQNSLLCIQSNIVGLPETTSYPATAATNSPYYFYRVLLQ
jgi:hypothetical protein